MKRSTLVSAILISVTGLISCSDFGSGPAPDPPPADTGISFQANIRPTLQTYCVSCHGGSGGFFVSTVENIKTTGNHAPNVFEGNGSGSNLVMKLSPSPPFGARMPFGGPYLSVGMIDTIKMWIDQGAKDN
jgi:hypothetical protein